MGHIWLNTAGDANLDTRQSFASTASVQPPHLAAFAAQGGHGKNIAPSTCFYHSPSKQKCILSLTAACFVHLEHLAGLLLMNLVY